MRPTITASTVPCGKLAFEIMSVRLPLEVMQSPRGFYLGTSNDAGPVSRESHEYWPTHDEAQSALEAGECAWNQRDEP
jgi:hypothetical protein